MAFQMLKFRTRENTLKEEHALSSIIIQYRLHTRVRVSGRPTCALYRYTNIYHVHYEKCIHLCIYYYYHGDGQNYYGLNPSPCCTCTSHIVYIMQYRTPAYTTAAAAPVLILHRVVMRALLTPSPSCIYIYILHTRIICVNSRLRPIQ